MLTYGLIFEQLPPTLAISLLAHECTTARMYAESTPEQRERLLPSLFAGTKICCTGTTEADVGSDPRSVSTRVERDGDELVEAVSLQHRIGEILVAEVFDAEAGLVQTIDSAIRSKATQLHGVENGVKVRVRIDSADPANRRVQLTAIL